MNNRKGNITNNRVWALWVSWTVSVGSIILIIALSLVVSKLWLPIVALIFNVALFLFNKYRKESNGVQCLLIPHLCMRILFWSAVVMVVINLIYHNVIPSTLFDSGLVNRDIPYITSMVTAPVTMVVVGWALLRRGRISLCHDCKMRNGDVSERGFIGKLYFRDSRYQTLLLFWFSLVHTIVSSIYYFVYYVNVNLNTPDKFYFVWIPVIFWTLSVVYLGFRYFSISIFYIHNEYGDYSSRERATFLRYLILCGDYMYLREIENSDGTVCYDTPVKITIPYRERVTDFDAATFYGNIVAEEGGERRLRFLYTSDHYNDDSKMFHYLSFVSSCDNKELSKLGGEWFSMTQIERLLNSQRLASNLSAEIIRLYKVTMAAKAYNLDGKRIYRIKNYRPTFRLSDIENLDVDFNDSRWLFVAFNNEDKPFYRFRRFWHRHVCGIQD